MRPADRRGRGFGQTEILYLPRANQLRHRANRFFDRCLGIDAMLVVEVDMIDTKSAQRGVAGGADMFGLSAHREERGVFLLPNNGKLCREEYLVASPANRATNELLVRADAVHVGGVEKVDTQVERAEDRGGGFRIVAGAVEIAHAHTAKSHARNGCTL